MAEYNSRIRYTLNTLTKQPGINDETTIGDMKKMFSDDTAARLVDQQIDAPTYAGTSFMRLTDAGLVLINTLTPKATKILMSLIGKARQSLRVQISQTDLAEMAQMSKPTVASAITELQRAFAIYVQAGDATNGEADTYYLNPAICSCSKISMQGTQEALFWRLSDEPYYSQKQYRQSIETAQQAFDESFSIREERDTTTREPLGITIERRGKIKTQEQVGRRRKKRASAANTDSQQDTTSPTSHSHNNPKYDINAIPPTDNMPNYQKKVPAFMTDPEIPFN